MKNQELKKMYVDMVMSESFGNSESMRKHFEKTISRVVELENGDLIAIEKPGIKKDFCFGYSDSRYDTKDFDRAQGMAHHARTNQEYFIQQNQKQLIEKIEAFEKWNAFVRTHYWKAPENTKIKCIEFVDDWKIYNMSDEEKAKLKKLSGYDKQKIIDAYEEERKDFDKRLMSYLKRYGLSNVKSWSYWRDA